MLSVARGIEASANSELTEARTLLAFDVCGSLFDTSGPHLHDAFTRILGGQRKELAQKIVGDWRTLQLEYSWRLNSMGQFIDFAEVTRMSLRHAFEANDAGEFLKEGVLEELLESYTELNCFDDAKKGLEGLERVEGVETVLFSNGPQSIVQKLLDGFPLPSYIRMKQPIVAESVHSFKPSVKFYEYLLDRTG